jgi:5-methylcytosine-specific restriction endonuclease McrA
MGYLDFTDAEMIALTRERRRERLLTIYMAPMPDMASLRLAYQRLHGSPLPEKPCVRHSALDARFQCRPLPVRTKVTRGRYVKPHDCDHGAMPDLIFRTFWRLQRGRCYLCQRPFEPDNWGTRDHVIPRALGGIDAGNVLLACFDCNNIKADRAPKPCEMLFLTAANAGFLTAYEKEEAA